MTSAPPGAIAKVAASVYATEDLFEKLIWDDRTDERDKERRLEHLSHLIDTMRETVVAAVEMGEEISTDLFKLRPRAGERDRESPSAPPCGCALRPAR